MIKRYLPIALAPIPLVVVFLSFCLWVIISPENLIDGKPDNAPDRAAMFLIIATPFIIYPLMVIFVLIQSLIMKAIRLTNILGCIVVGTASAIPIAILFVKIIHASKSGESLTKAIVYCVGLTALASCMTLFTFLGIKKLTANKKLHQTPEGSLLDI
jgi:hypothetical protein